jgi:hypothetical protein
MQTLNPALLSGLTALSAAVLMVHAGVGKRLLRWRPDAARRRQPRKPRRRGRSGFPGGRR